MKSLSVILAVSGIYASRLSAEDRKTNVSPHEFIGSAMGTVVLAPTLWIGDILPILAKRDSDGAQFRVSLFRSCGATVKAGDKVMLQRVGYEEQPGDSVKFIIATPVSCKAGSLPIPLK